MRLRIQKKRTQCLTATMVSVEVFYRFFALVYTSWIWRNHSFCFPFNEAWESPGLERADEDERGGFSEHELLDIMYSACNRANTGARLFVALKRLCRYWQFFQLFLHSSCSSSFSRGSFGLHHSALPAQHDRTKSWAGPTGVPGEAAGPWMSGPSCQQRDFPRLHDGVDLSVQPGKVKMLHK